MNTLMTKKGIFQYRGVTRISKMEPIPEKSLSYKAKIQRVYFPGAMFIFAVPKKVMSDNFSNQRIGWQCIFSTQH